MPALNKHFVKGPIPLGGIGKWSKVSGALGGYLFMVLHYRLGLSKYGKLESVTLPREVKKHFGLTRRIMERLRGELIKAGLLEAKRESGGPYKYKILEGE